MMQSQQSEAKQGPVAVPDAGAATRVSAQTVRDAAFDAMERKADERAKKHEVAKMHRRRLEWTVLGATRDLQKYTQQQPIQVENLARALTLCLTVVNELRDVAGAEKQIEEEW